MSTSGWFARHPFSIFTLLLLLAGTCLAEGLGSEVTSPRFDSSIPAVSQSAPLRESPGRERRGSTNVGVERKDQTGSWSRGGAGGLSEAGVSLHRLIVEVPKPLSSSRLEFCVEFTKPDSLCIRLMGTPKNHRSPPA